MLSLTLHFALLVVLGIAAYQDYKTRTVANKISVPLFLSGFAAAVWRAFVGNPLPLVLSVALLLFYQFGGGVGGADIKTLIGVLGLWPLAGIAAFFALGLGGTIVLLINGAKNLPGVTLIAAGFLLTFLGELSIMFAN